MLRYIVLAGLMALALPAAAQSPPVATAPGSNVVPYGMDASGVWRPMFSGKAGGGIVRGAFAARDQAWWGQNVDGSFSPVPPDWWAESPQGVLAWGKNADGTYSPLRASGAGGSKLPPARSALIERKTAAGVLVPMKALAAHGMKSPPGPMTPRDFLPPATTPSPP